MNKVTTGQRHSRGGDDRRDDSSTSFHNPSQLRASISYYIIPSEEP